MDAPGRGADVPAVLAHLQALECAANRAGMARFGINAEHAFGVPNSVLRPLARTLGRNHDRALALWRAGWREARLLAAFTADPALLTHAQAADWAADFDSWDIVDGVADLLAATPFWRELIAGFAADEREFVRRAAFSVLVQACVHRKEEPDATFIAALELVAAHAGDGRNFVKKAVNWALRQIGKRSPQCYGPALALAQRLAGSDNPVTRWIGADAERELTSPAVLERITSRRTPRR